METTQTIRLIFKAQEGENVSMNINAIRDNVTKDEIEKTMDAIISKNIFMTKHGDLIAKAGAQVIERNVTKYEMV